MRQLAATLLCVLLFHTGAWGQETHPQNPTPKDPDQAMPGAAKTIYFDIGPISRKHRAAERMTRLHKKNFTKGWTVIDVEPYIENGDLQGFFITYVGRQTNQTP